jgi:hypothetical protein
MTCPIVPEFILKLFEKEISNIVDRCVVKICDEYELDNTEVKKLLAREMNMSFDIVNEDIEQIKIVKKNTKHEKESGACCEARIYIASELIVKQCSRSKLHDNCKFCKTHHKQFETNSLKWGTIHDPKPDAISTAKLNAKAKRKIY